MRNRVIVLGAVLLVALAAVAVALHRRNNEQAPLVNAPADPASTEVDAGTDAPGESPPPPELPPSPAEPLAVAAADTELGVLLEPDAPTTVRLLAERRDRADRFVLVAVDRSSSEPPSNPTAEPADDEGLEDEDGLEDEEPCAEEDGNDDVWCECMFRTEATSDRGWRAALGRPVVRIELARIHVTPTRQRLEARIVLTDPVLEPLAAVAVDAERDGPWLRANDMDGDGRVEVTALFSFDAPDCDTFQDDQGTLGVILDGADLHVQAAFARAHHSVGGDSDVNSNDEECVWRATDEDGDGHGDLRVRRTSRASMMEAEDDAPREAHSTQSWTCPYDVVNDRWRCPEEAAPLLTEWVRTVAPSLVL